MGWFKYQTNVLDLMDLSALIESNLTVKLRLDLHQTKLRCYGSYQYIISHKPTVYAIKQVYTEVYAATETKIMQASLSS